MTPERSLEIVSRLIFALVGSMIVGSWLYQKLGLSFLPPFIALHMVPFTAAVAAIVGLAGAAVALSKRNQAKITAIQQTAIGKRRRMYFRVSGVLCMSLPIVLIVAIAVLGLRQGPVMHSIATLAGYSIVLGIALIVFSFYVKDN